MDLIDRKWLLSVFHNKAFDKANTNTAYNELRWAIKVIKQAPSARPKGKWILNRDGNWCCPFCGNDPYHDNMKNMNFCPNCGADMRGEQDG